MKFQNCILITFVMDAGKDRCTHGQAESNMPLQLFRSWGHNKDSLQYFSRKCNPLSGVLQSLRSCYLQRLLA